MKPQLINIILLKKELIHDIEADIARLEHAALLSVAPDASRQPSSAGTSLLSDNDTYTLSREIDNAYNTALSRLQAYLTLPTSDAHRITTNHSHDWQEKSILLALPNNWPPHCLNPLRDAIHTYIVKSAVLAVITPQLPDSKYVPVIAQQQERAYNDIAAIANTRIGSLRIQPTFLG